jgi:putative peptidoglycan lipid II flippase
MSRAVVRALKYVVLFSLAATAGLMALSIPVVRMLYERGSFDVTDTIATAGTVVFFALGIPLWGIQQILARGFYAREQMWAPVLVGTLSTAAAVPIYWALYRSMGVDGLALASTLSILLYTVALAILWYGRTGWEYAAPVALAAMRALPVAALAGFASWGAAEWVLSRFSMNGFGPAVVAVAVGGVVLLGLVAAPPWPRRDLSA